MWIGIHIGRVMKNIVAEGLKVRKSNYHRIIYIFLVLILYDIKFSMAAETNKTPASPKGLVISSEPVPPPSTPLPPPGNEGLLSGMTPGNLKVPSGWTLVRTQDFEGNCGEGEWCGRWDGSVTTTKPHTGSNSIEGTYANDQSDVGWTLNSGYVGSFQELYFSFYEYVESQALFNDEYFQARFAVGSGSDFQEVILDWYWAEDSQGRLAFNQQKATLYVIPQGVYTKRLAAKTDSIPKGSWVQWEILFRPNTVGQNNGLIRVYVNGTYYTGADNVQLVGRSMEDCSVMAGGQYTKLVWMTDYPTCTKCSSVPGDGTDFCTASMGFFGQSFSDPVCSPQDPPLPAFKRFIDDIILMKR